MRKLLVLGLMAAFIAPIASAHVVAIGYTPGAIAGSVNLWLGSYHCGDCNDGPNLEGSAHLVGTSVTYDTTTAFTIAEYVTDYSTPAAPPTGLTLGDNLFCDLSYSATCLSNIFSWQAAAITGLDPGDYVFTYVPIGNPTAHWAPWSNTWLDGNQGVALTLEAGDITPVPEPGMLALLGLGLAGLGFSRRRQRA